MSIVTTRLHAAREFIISGERYGLPGVVLVAVSQYAFYIQLTSYTDLLAWAAYCEESEVVDSGHGAVNAGFDYRDPDSGYLIHFYAPQRVALEVAK